MNIKPILEQLISDEIDEIGLGLSVDCRFAIHEQEGIQVQILVTREESEHLEIYKPYAKA